MLGISIWGVSPIIEGRAPILIKPGFLKEGIYRDRLFGVLGSAALFLLNLLSQSHSCFLKCREIYSFFQTYPPVRRCVPNREKPFVSILLNILSRKTVDSNFFLSNDQRPYWIFQLLHEHHFLKKAGSSGRSCFLTSHHLSSSKQFVDCLF